MSLPIEHVMPDPHTFTVVINERQRKLIHRALRLLLQDTDDAPSCEIELAESLEDMLNPKGSTGPLVASPAINSFVL
jgi:hypothetical protein